MKKLIWISIILCLLLVTFSHSSSNLLLDRFNDTTTAKNLTYTSAGNQSVFFVVPNMSSITGANITIRTINYVNVTINLLNMTSGCNNNISFEPSATYPLEICLNDGTSDSGCNYYTSGNYSSGTFVETNMTAINYSKQYRVKVHWQRIGYNSTNGTDAKVFDNGGNTTNNIYDVCGSPYDSDVWYNDVGCGVSSHNFGSYSPVVFYANSNTCSGTAYYRYIPTQSEITQRSYENPTLGGSNATKNGYVLCLQLCGSVYSFKDTVGGTCTDTSCTSADYISNMATSCSEGTAPTYPSSICTYAGDNTEYSNYFTITGSSISVAFTEGKANGNLTLDFASKGNVSFYVGTTQSNRTNPINYSSHIVDLNSTLLNINYSLPRQSNTTINITIESDAIRTIEITSLSILYNITPTLSITYNGQSNYSSSTSTGTNISYFNITLTQDLLDNNTYSMNATNDLTNFTVIFVPSKVSINNTLVNTTEVRIRTDKAVEGNHNFTIWANRSSYDNKQFNFSFSINIVNYSANVRFTNSSAWIWAGYNTETATREIEINNTGTWNCSNVTFTINEGGATGALNAYKSYNSTGIVIQPNQTQRFNISIVQPPQGVYSAEFLSFTCIGTDQNSIVASTNSIEMTFISSIQSTGGSGGGGGSTTKVTANESFKFITESGSDFLDLFIIADATRNTQFFIKNKGNVEHTYALNCEGQVCSWITIDPQEFTLNPEEEQIISISIKVPSTVAYGDSFTAKINAVNNYQYSQSISVKLTTSRFSGYAIIFINKLGEFVEFNGQQTFLPKAVVIFGIPLLFFLLTMAFKVSNKKALAVKRIFQATATFIILVATWILV